MQLIATTDPSWRRRGPFLAPAEIVVLAAMVGALLLLLFPGRDFASAAFRARPDDVSVAYLSMALRGYPNQAETRLLLAQHQTALGKLEDARQTLAPLRGRDDALGQQALLLGLNIDRARLYALVPADPRRPILQDEVRRAALALIPRTTGISDLAELADLALALENPGAAARAYRRLAVLDKHNTVGWLEKAGHWSYSAGDAALAAKDYTDAALGTTDPAQGVKLARQALTALLAANQGNAGLSIARPLVERYPQDLALLEQAIVMAVATNDLNSARRWGEQRLAAAGSSTAVVLQQIDILVKANDSEGGFRLAHSLLLRSPNDPVLRRQVAQLARWSSHPEEALGQWVWLARHTNSEEGREKALDLARLLNDSDVEVEMLLMKANRAHRQLAPRVPPEAAPASATPL